METRAWKANRGLHVESEKCRIRRQAKETIMHWLSECKGLAATEYLKRYNKINTVWYKERWNKGTAIENDECKLCCDFEYDLHKTTSARRPDVTLSIKKQEQNIPCPRLVRAKTMWMQSMQGCYKNSNKLHLRSQRETTRVQCNDNLNGYWLLR